MHAPSFDPGGPHAPSHTARSMLPSAIWKSVGFRDLRPYFEAQSRGLHTRCLRFAAGVAPEPRKTRYRLVASLRRTGLVTRLVPLKGFSYASSSPRLVLAHSKKNGSVSLSGRVFTCGS